jgi:hypothetical protein
VRTKEHRNAAGALRGFFSSRPQDTENLEENQAKEPRMAGIPPIARMDQTSCWSSVLSKLFASSVVRNVSGA